VVGVVAAAWPGTTSADADAGIAEGASDAAAPAPRAAFAATFFTAAGIAGARPVSPPEAISAVVETAAADCVGPADETAPTAATALAPFPEPWSATAEPACVASSTAAPRPGADWGVAATKAAENDPDPSEADAFCGT
jgi:hypothetical protein